MADQETMHDQQTFHPPMTLKEKLNHLENMMGILVNKFETMELLQGPPPTPPPHRNTPLPPPTITTTQVPARGPKIATPKPFDGQMKNCKTFIRQSALYTNAKKSEFPDDKAKIVFALSYMEDKAAVYANAAIDEIERNEEDATKCAYPFKGKYATFIAHLRETFEDLMPTRTAQNKLNKLIQGTGTADEYVLEFRRSEEHTSELQS